MLFSEILRTLKPNGMFVAGDWLRGEYEEVSEQMALFYKLTDNEFDIELFKGTHAKAPS